jgi:hypothetical protein
VCLQSMGGFVRPPAHTSTDFLVLVLCWFVRRGAGQIVVSPGRSPHLRFRWHLEATLGLCGSVCITGSACITCTHPTLRLDVLTE